MEVLLLLKENCLQNQGRVRERTRLSSGAMRLGKKQTNKKPHENQTTIKKKKSSAVSNLILCVAKHF